MQYQERAIRILATHQTKRIAIQFGNVQWSELKTIASKHIQGK